MRLGDQLGTTVVRDGERLARRQTSCAPRIGTPPTVTSGNALPLLPGGQVVVGSNPSARRPKPALTSAGAGLCWSPEGVGCLEAALAQRMHSGGESATTIAAALGVSRATVYRVLAEQADGTE